MILLNSIKDPHDKLYKELLNSKLEFSIFLKYFLNYNISPEKLINYHTNFITTEYNNKSADIVYKIIDKPIFFLIEHQSYIDYSMPYRILEYYIEILRSSISKKALKTNNYRFPLICPIILYIGAKKWQLRENISYKQYHSNYRGKISLPFYFISIHNYSINNLINLKSNIAHVMAIYKCKTYDEVINLLEEFCKCSLDDQSKENFKKILNFFLKTLFDEIKINSLIEQFNKEEIDMDNFFERIRNDKLNYGLKMKQEGVSQGISKGKLEIIVNMLKCGLSVDDIKKYSGYTKKKIESIIRDIKTTV